MPGVARQVSNLTLNILEIVHANRTESHRSVIVSIVANLRQKFYLANFPWQSFFVLCGSSVQLIDDKGSATNHRANRQTENYCKQDHIEKFYAKLLIWSILSIEYKLVHSIQAPGCIGKQIELPDEKHLIWYRPQRFAANQRDNPQYHEGHIAKKDESCDCISVIDLMIVFVVDQHQAEDQVEGEEAFGDEVKFGEIFQFMWRWQLFHVDRAHELSLGDSGSHGFNLGLWVYGCLLFLFTGCKHEIVDFLWLRPGLVNQNLSFLTLSRFEHYFLFLDVNIIIIEH